MTGLVKSKLSQDHFKSSQDVTDAKREERKPRISFEFFPPKTSKMEKSLWTTIRALEECEPEFVSVTYGAGGTTRDRTHDTVARIAQTTKLNAAAHLTTVGSTQSEVKAIAQGFWDAGVKHIVALRGDSPDGVGEAYMPTKGGYAYASDLVAGLGDVADFEISVAAYPERHPESPCWKSELDNLKRKEDAGATRAITQFFYAPETFLEFVERVKAAGIHMPIVPGIMLQPNFTGLKRMSGLCDIEVPEWYSAPFEGKEDDPAACLQITAALVNETLARLFDEGVESFHLYTLNRSKLAIAVTDALRHHARTKQTLSVH